MRRRQFSAIHGHMYKEGQCVWERRMFLLRVRSATLEHYDENWQLRGSVDLEVGVSLSDNAKDNDGDRYYEFQIETSNGSKSLKLRCETSESKRRWMAALTQVLSGDRNPDEVYRTWSYTRARDCVDEGSSHSSTRFSAAFSAPPFSSSLFA